MAARGFKLVLSLLLLFLALQSTLISCSRLHLLQAPSGPNPGGNSHTQTSPRLVAGSGPNPGGNSKIDGSIKVHVSKVPKNEVLDAAPSGPNPGGNAALLGDAKVASLEKPLQLRGVVLSKLPKNTPTPNPGPSPVHNSVSKVVKEKLVVEDVAKTSTPNGSSVSKLVKLPASRLVAGEVELRGKLPNTPTPNPGPGTGHNSVSKMVKLPASRLVAGEVDLRSKLPNNPTPNPGPGTGHNSVSKILTTPARKIGCGGEMDSNLFGASSARVFSRN